MSSVLPPADPAAPSGEPVKPGMYAVPYSSAMHYPGAHAPPPYPQYQYPPQYPVPAAPPPGASYGVPPPVPAYGAPPPGTKPLGNPAGPPSMPAMPPQAHMPYPMAGPVHMPYAAQPLPVTTTGWDVLEHLERIFVKQRLEYLEYLTGFETDNAYDVYHVDAMGNRQKVFYMEEQSSAFQKLCCGASRAFDMRITTVHNGQLFMKATRPFRWTFMCFNRPIIQVFDGAGNVLGSVRSPVSFGRMRFDIHDASEQHVLRIDGSQFQWGMLCRHCCGDIVLDVEAASGEKIGEVRKVYSNYAQERFTDADNYSCTFPRTLPVLHKGLLLAAVILVDFLHFENNNGARHR